MSVQDRPVPPGTREVRREPWADAAKGVLILLVVLWHTTRKHYVHLPWVPAPVEAVWLTGSQLLQPVRVPLFFLVSGYLAARAVHRPWRVVLRRRVLRDYWVYLVWLVLGSAFFTVVPGITTSTAHTWGELALGVVVGYTNAWYLYALAVYLVVAKACRSLPRPVWLGLGVVLAVVAEVKAVPSHGNTESLLGNLLPFLVGALAPRLVAEQVRRATWRRVLVTWAVFLPLVGVAVAVGLSRAVVVTLVLAVPGTAAGLLLAVRASHAFPTAAAVLGRVGRRTLPVYVLHLPLLALLHAGARRVQVPEGPAAALLAVVYPTVAVALLTAVSLALHRVLLALGLGVLFRLPRRPASVPDMTRTRA